jgi:DUF1680 family protein
MLTLSQSTDHPRDDVSRFTLDLRTPTRFTLALRIPAWAGQATRVTLNGRPLPATLSPGSFFRIDHLWRPGDRIALFLDQTLRLEPLNAAHPELVALMRGPRVLFAASELDAPMSRADLFKPFTAIGDEPSGCITERLVRLRQAAPTRACRCMVALSTCDIIPKTEHHVDA